MERSTKTHFSPPEAAFVTGLSAVLINKAIDRGEISSQRVNDFNSVARRQLGEPELIYLTLLKDVSGALQRPYRRLLYEKLSAGWPRYKPTRINLGIVGVDVSEAHQKVRDRIRLLRRMSRLIVSDPDIRGGEPVIKGTRVPVYTLADIAKQGATIDDLLEDYPSVSRDGIEAALIYAAVNPRRGRPPQAPWREDVTE